MAKKNKRTKDVRNKPTELAHINATIKKLQSALIAPDMQNYLSSGMIRGVREKLLSLNFNTIRNIVDRIPLISAIINTRVDQVIKFNKYSASSRINEAGYEFYMANPNLSPTTKDQKVFFQLSEFLSQTGLIFDPDREDDFADYLSMVVRETLTIDQISTELQRNRKGEVIAFWLLDASTIKRVNPEDAKSSGSVYVFKPNTRFAQIIEDKIYNEYTGDDIIFDYKNKRVDLKFRGYGYSPVEQSIDLLTTLLFGYNFLRDQMMRDKIPKGFISVMGDAGKDQLDAIRNYWFSAMQGAGGQWNIPILPSGKEGIGIDFKTIQPSNRDMEYRRLMMFLTSIIAAVFSIDLAELGIKSDDSRSLIGESAEPSLKASKDKGLTSLISFIEQHVNKIIRKVNENYKLRFTGIEREDDQKLATLRRQDVETFITINEIREAQGLEKLEDDYAKVVLNPQAVQIYSQGKMAERAGGGGVPGGEAEGGGEEEIPPGEAEGGEEGTSPDENGAEVDWKSVFKSMKDDKTVKIVIE